MPTSIKLTAKQKARIAKAAKEAGKSPHAFMIGAIEQQLDQAEKRRSFLEDARAAQKEFEETGLGYALEDVDEYLTRLARGERPSRPKPKSWRR